MPADLEGHAIIVGYGRVGQMLGSLLEAQKLPHVALDSNAGLVARFRNRGAGVYYGDARRLDFLCKVAIDRAAALVVTVDDPATAERVVATARRHWPDLVIYARARDAAHAARLIGQGASHAIPETTEASPQLSEMVLVGAGVPDDDARQMVELRRQSEQAAVDESRRGG